MAVGTITLSAQMEGLREMRDALGQILQPAQKADIIAAALEKAIQPAFRRLYEITPVGPTGNLRAAAAKKIVKYRKDGAAIALLGYRRSGQSKAESAAGGTVRVAVGNDPDRAFHQWWLENGTKPRTVNRVSMTPFTRRAHKRVTPSGTIANVAAHSVAGQGGVIASSYRRLGPFKVMPGSDPQNFTTDPPYQRAFLKKSRDPITIDPFPKGGYAGRPPLTTAWNETQATVAGILMSELSVSLDLALSAIAMSSTGSVTP